MKLTLKQSILKNDKQSILTIFSLSFAFIVIIVLSLGTQFYFKPIEDEGFWGDLTFSVALCIYSLYFGIPEAKSFYQKKENGRFQNALFEFKSIREETIKRDFEFNQWLVKYYQKNKLDYLKMVLSAHGNINPYVLDLDINELDNLRKPYKKNWDDTEFKGREETYFRTLTEDQIKIIKDIFKGKISVQQIPDDFFKTFEGKVVANEYVEQSKRQKKDGESYVILIIFRIIMAVVIAVLLAIFGIKVAENPTKEEIVNQVFNIVSRLWTMISSFTYGFGVGKVMVVNQTRILEYKVRVNSEFINDRNFKGLSEEEVAKQEYEVSLNE